jgi:hypothetical protein
VPYRTRGWPPSEPGRQTSHPQHHQNYIHSTSTPYLSTTMDPILDAIAEIESREPGASFSYRQLAKKYQCDRTTLSCKHQGLTDSHAGANRARANLTPEQDLELAKYIEQLSGEGLPPTRAMIRNFASGLAKEAVSERWVGRFLKRHSGLLTNTYVNGMDHNQVRADSYDKYKAYFELLHSKMSKYNLPPDRIYNMDEKGFLLGVTKSPTRTPCSS